MLILAYRQNELGGLGRRFGENIDLEETNVTTIQVDDLPFDAVEELVADATHMGDKNKVKNLAELVYEKTKGNAFFTIEFLKALKDEELLYFSSQTCSWEWDTERIRVETSISDNVVDLLVSKLRRLNRRTRDVLKIAACMGAAFNFQVISPILGEYEINDLEIDHILKQDAVRELIYKQKDPNWFCFSHDKVREAAYYLIPDSEEREALHYRIGSLLLKNITMNTPGSDPLLLLAADQLNHCPIHVETKIETSYLAELNLKAAKNLIDMSAFYAASNYLKHARNHIGRCGGWQQHYNLMLNVSTLLSQIYFCQGDIKSSREIAMEVLSKSNSIVDKSNAYFTLLNCAGAEGDVPNLLRLGWEALAELGEKLPSKITYPLLVLECIKTRKLLLKISAEDIMHLKLMDSPKKKAATKILNFLSDILFTKVGVAQFLYVRLRILKISFQYGINEYLPNAFITYGQFLANRGNCERAYEFGLLALKLSRKLHAEKGTSLSAFFLHAYFLNHLRNPVHQSIPLAIEGYKSRMTNGDISRACHAAGIISYLRLFCGQNLHLVEEEMLTSEQQFADYKQVSVITTTGLRRILVEPLLGKRNPSDCAVDNEVINTAKWEHSPRVVTASRVLRIVRLFYFGLASDLKQYESEAWNNIFLLFQSVHHVHVCMCILGMAEFMLAREFGDRKYARRGTKLCKILKGHFKKGNPNAEHLFLLLDAERLHFLRKRRSAQDLIKGAYSKAIKSASRSGFVNIAALANELFASYLLKISQPELATFYVNKALQLYKEWGAEGKIDQLQAKYSFLLEGNLLSKDEEVARNQRFLSLHKKRKIIAFTDILRHQNEELSKHNYLGSETFCTISSKDTISCYDSFN